MVNVIDGKIIRLLVEDEPLDMRYGAATTTSGCSTSARAR